MTLPGKVCEEEKCRVEELLRGRKQKLWVRKQMRDWAVARSRELATGKESHR